jgi:hypothetical protein
VPHAAFIAAYLLKLDWGQKSLGELRVSLSENPGLVWLLGFPPAVSNPDAGRCLPLSKAGTISIVYTQLWATSRHFSLKEPMPKLEVRQAINCPLIRGDSSPLKRGRSGCRAGLFHNCSFRTGGSGRQLVLVLTDLCWHKFSESRPDPPLSPEWVTDLYAPLVNSSNIPFTQ